MKTRGGALRRWGSRSVRGSGSNGASSSRTSGGRGSPNIRGIRTGGQRREQSYEHEMRHEQVEHLNPTEDGIDGFAFDPVGALQEGVPSVDKNSIAQPRFRGEGRGTNAPDLPLDRPTIRIVDGTIDHPTAMRSISPTIQEWFTEPWPTWSKVPDNVKDVLWGEFKKKWRWDPPTTDQEVKKIWYKTADNRFRQLTMKVRLAAKNGRARPKFVTGGVLNGLNQHWSNTKYKEICKQNSKNRLSDVNGHGTVTHCGGSISFVTHERRMREENEGRPVSKTELFLRTHKKLKGKGEFVNEKSKTIFEKYLAIKETNEQSLEGTSHENATDFDPVAWHKASGGKTKRQLYGFGSSTSTSLMLNGSTSTTSPEPSCFTPEQVRSLLQVPVFQVEVQDQIQSVVRGIEERVREDMEVYVRGICSSLGISEPSEMQPPP